MRKVEILCASVLLLVASSSKGQNLVNDPSFEAITCGNSDRVELNANDYPWFAPNTGSSDIRCVNPRTGNQHGGFSVVGTKYEYLSSKLLDTLKASCRYRVEFYLKTEDPSFDAIDSIGIHFSKDSISESSSLNINALPQIATNAEEGINNFNYELFSDSFEASGGEAYLTIGNFNNPSNLYTEGNLGFNYYYVDDISLVLIDCDTITPPDTSVSDTTNPSDTTSNPTDSILNQINKVYIPNAFSPNNDGINDLLIVQGEGIKSYQINIFDRFGLNVFSSNNIKERFSGKYKGKKLTAGSYNYDIIVTYIDNTSETLIGNITLLR